MRSILLALISVENGGLLRRRGDSDDPCFPFHVPDLEVLLAINIGLHKLPVGARVLASAKRSRMNHNLLEQVRNGPLRQLCLTYNGEDSQSWASV